LRRSLRLFFSHSSSILSRPICSKSSAFWASASDVAALPPLLKTWSAPASSCFFQAWMSVGWTPYCPASSLTVRSPLRAARATWALNAAVCCFRLPAMNTPFLGHQSSLAGGPVFGVHYTARLQLHLAAHLQEHGQGSVLRNFLVDAVDGCLQRRLQLRLV